MEIGCEGPKYSTTSERFSNFMLILKKFWTLVWKRDIRNSKFIVDNAAVHIAQNTKLSVIHLDCEVLWLPQYSPNLEPVEWVFGVSKRIIRNFKPLKTINYSLNLGKSVITESMGSLNRVACLKMWSKFVDEVKQILMRCRIIINLNRLN